ncbi:MAG TPA: type II toxin-antitoxin system VapB family antitoxin [Solirubrobacterales bacterium]|nr:type II toxin-antitoxin system VapB family antitoxin [Solirubrobacterales bacterium]
MSKTSFEVDPEKVEAAKQILGTKTLTDTVDAALEEIVKRRQRERLAKLLFDPNGPELDNPEVMKNAWRIGGRG